MIIVGIDTAIRCTGYGVVKIQRGGKIAVLDCGVIKNKTKAPHSECLRRLYGGINEICKSFQPEVAALESAFYQKNVKTAMILSYAKGAVMTALANNAIPAYAYAPKKAKQAVVGTGTASKEQVASVIASMTGLNLDQIPLDATDALAIAICHGYLAIRTNVVDFLDKPL